MPPAVSDDESDMDIADEIPAKATRSELKPLAADEEDDDDDDEQDEDEYIVEEVLGHKKQRGKILYDIKWFGYEDEADRTWEPLENLENAKDALQKYHDRIGEIPSGTQTSGKKGKGKAAGKRGSETVDSPVPTKKQRGGRKSDANGENGDFEPPIGSWEQHVVRVEAILEEEDDVPAGSKRGAKDNKTLLGLLAWNNGRKTQHNMSILRTKCPQRLLDYYENHLVFKGDPRYVDEQ